MSGFHSNIMSGLPAIDPEKPLLIAGPTASGKSALALEIAIRQGGVIVNADASQVYDCFRIVTARPSAQDEAAAPHALYGHISWQQSYSAGDWLREVSALLDQGIRPIITGGTGLYFQTLTRGMANIPPIPPEIRARADALPLPEMIAALDAPSAAAIDLQNRARVQRAYEVLSATGRGIRSWQQDTAPPCLALSDCTALVVDCDRDWLIDRIERRFDIMLDQGALPEVAAMAEQYDPALPVFRAIGVPELMAYHLGQIDLDTARTRATIATRRFAKRQRTWFRSKMDDWHKVSPR